MSQVTPLPHLNSISLGLKTGFVWEKKKKVDSFGFLVIFQNLR